MIFFLNNSYKKQWWNGTGVGEVGAELVILFNHYIHLLCGCDSVLNAENAKYVHNILYGNFIS